MARMMLVTLPMFMLLLSMNSGCSSLTKDKGAKKDSPFASLQFWKKGYQQPTKMAVLWSHDLLTVAGQPPTRGFGGRIYFYNARSQTIPVEGELVVHGFDETLKKVTGSEETQPDKRFRFTAEQFTEHFSESDLGASYSVWIPWDAGDGMQKELTLIPTFISSKGEMVQGAPAKVVLPGRTGLQPGQHTPVQTVAYEQATVPTTNGKLPNLVAPATNSNPASTNAATSMRTTTINMPAGGRRAQPVGNPSAANAAQTSAASPTANVYLEQARAQAMAEAFRPTDAVMPQRPTQSYSAWNPSVIPTAGSTAVNLVNIMPPNQQTGASFAPQVGPAVQPQMQQPQMQQQAQPQMQQRVPSGDEYPGGLPPGIQLTPRPAGW